MITSIIDIISTVKVYFLKRIARSRYTEYYKIRDHYTCGKQLAEQISPKLLKLKNEFNNTMDALSHIDPNTPKERL